MSRFLLSDKLMRAMSALQPQEAVSEQGYRELFENHPLIMWVHDSETLRFLAVNDAAIRNYGYSRDEFLAMQVTALGPAQGGTGFKNEPRASTQSTSGHQRKDGTSMSVEMYSYPVIFEERNAVAVICKESSPRKQKLGLANHQNQELEKRVRDRTAQLEAMNRELEAFCYSVSHDLRAPLRSIRGFSEVLLERYAVKVDARGQELLRRVCESSQVMDHLIEDLLKLSRVTRIELQRQPVNLSTLAKAIAQELHEAEPARVVDFVIAPNLKADGDERLLHLVLDNLIRNAWKFTSKRTAAVIEVGRTKDPEPAFFVRDNGAGFDMAYAQKLFGVFQRLHSPHDFPGTGVGLAIVQRIVRRHGGRTWARGEVDQGATFYFTLGPDWT
jgi:PAS domain S-box-containing protein